MQLDPLRRSLIIGLVVGIVASVGLIGLLSLGRCGGPLATPTPCPSSQALDIDSWTLNSPTDVTLNLRNGGYATATLSSYYVKDSGGDTYAFANSQWVGPSIGPNGLVAVHIIIDGQRFVFQHGSTYSVIMTTTSYYQFTMTLTL